MPPLLLGLPGDNTFSNYAEANRAFWRQCVIPLVRRTQQAFAGFLQPRYGALRLEADLDRIDALAGEREAEWRRIGAAGFLSDAEKREALGWRGGGKRKFAQSRLRRKDDDWEDWESGGDDGASGPGGGGHWQSQPRVPAGSPDGGQWTDGEGALPGAGIFETENPGAIQVSSGYTWGTLISQFPGPAGLKCVYRFDFGDVLLDGPGIGTCWSEVLSSQAWHGQLLNDNYQKAMMQDLEMKSDNLKKDDLIPARFTISGAAKAHIEAAKEDFNKNSLDPLDVVGIGWGEIRPKGGRVFEDVVVGFYRLSQKREILHLIQNVSGVDLVYYVAPANQEKFEDKTLDYTETRGFHLR